MKRTRRMNEVLNGLGQDTTDLSLPPDSASQSTSDVLRNSIDQAEQEAGYVTPIYDPLAQDLNASYAATMPASPPDSVNTSLIGTVAQWGGRAYKYVSAPGPSGQTVARAVPVNQAQPAWLKPLVMAALAYMLFG